MSLIKGALQNEVSRGDLLVGRVLPVSWLGRAPGLPLRHLKPRLISKVPWAWTPPNCPGQLMPLVTLPVFLSARVHNQFY